MTINCQPPAHATPTEHQAHADQWLPTTVMEPAAVRLCDGCPARLSCLDWALDFTDPVTGGHVEGVWGGTTTEQRQKMRRGGEAAA
jgi:hypothetical protein